MEALDFRYGLFRYVTVARASVYGQVCFSAARDKDSIRLLRDIVFPRIRYFIAFICEGCNASRNLKKIKENETKSYFI